MNTFLTTLKSAERAGVPLVAATTMDAPATVDALVSHCNGSRVVLCHDVTRGLTAPREADRDLLAKVCGEREPVSLSPVEAIQEFTAKCSARSGAVLAMIAGDRNLERPETGIALMLARDELAAKGCRIILVCSNFTSPPELGSDVLLINDAPPSFDERLAICRKIGEGARMSCSTLVLTDEDYDFAARYTRGLSRFATSQTFAMALRKDGLDRFAIRDVWAQAVRGVKGLSVAADPTNPSLDSIKGNTNLKRFATQLLNGKDKIDAFFWVDEFEKLFANTAGDLSGASNVILKKFLTKMEQRKWRGMIIVGPPGTGKSMAATMLGAVGGVPTIAANPEDSKGGLVGDVERDCQRMLDTVDAMGGSIYCVATSNSMAEVPDALVRRFTDQVWFQDLPLRPERLPMWDMYRAEYGLGEDPGNETPADDRGYTGADIRNVCRNARNFDTTIAEVCANYVPSSRAAAGRITAMRRAAVGNFLSTSYPGVYRMPGDEPEPAAAPSATRRIDLGA